MKVPNKRHFKFFQQKCIFWLFLIFCTSDLHLLLNDEYVKNVIDFFLSKMQFYILLKILGFLKYHSLFNCYQWGTGYKTNIKNSILLIGCHSNNTWHFSDTHTHTPVWHYLQKELFFRTYGLWTVQWHFKRFFIS